jgi:hypothetical protein
MWVKGDEVSGHWRRLHNEMLYYLHSSRNIIRVTKSKRLRWEGHLARMGERRSAYRVLIERPERKSRFEDPGVILNRIFKKCDGETWTGLIWLRIGTGSVLVNAGMKIRVSQNAENFSTS